MKSLRQTIRDVKCRVSAGASQLLKPSMERMGTRLRLQARIRLLNSKASKNPKWTFAIVLSSLLMLTVFTLFFPYEKTADRMQMARIETAGMDSVFDGFREIQLNKDIHQKNVNEMTLAGQKIRHRLDSLIGLPIKTKGDSIEIRLCYYRLDRIVKYLKPDPNSEGQ